MATVVCLHIDMIGSVKAGLAMHALQFESFNREWIRYSYGEIESFCPEGCQIKSAGDGWLLFSENLNMVHAFVALAKTLATNFQRDVAALPRLKNVRLPELRLTVCTGDDIKVAWGNESDWQGDSARRAHRAAQCARPNQVIINDAVREKILRVFHIRRIQESELPQRWKEEEDFSVFHVGNIFAELATALEEEPDPAIYLPYSTFLKRTGYFSEAERAFRNIRRAVVGAHDTSSSCLTNPADIAKRKELGAKLRKLLCNAPSDEIRDGLVHDMMRLDVPPTLHVYTHLMRIADTYEGAVNWYRRMDRNRVEPDAITLNTLIARCM